jgi:hypothetical protein
MDEDPFFRKLIGHFKEFHQAEMLVNFVPSEVFSRHIKIDLPLGNTLISSCASPLTEVALHLFVLKKDDDFTRTNATVINYALEQERRGINLLLSNQGGFHSHQALFRDSMFKKDVLMRKLEQTFVRAAAETLADEAEKTGEVGRLFAEQVAAEISGCSSSWVNVNRHGHSNGLHDHANATWSGVYYASVPKPARTKSLDATDNSTMLRLKHSGRFCVRTAVGGFEGKLKKGDVRATNPEKPEGWCQYAFVDPTEGLLVLFPSWLQHMVMPLVDPDAVYDDTNPCLNGHQQSKTGKQTREEVGSGGGLHRVSLAFNFGEPENATPPTGGGASKRKRPTQGHAAGAGGGAVHSKDKDKDERVLNAAALAEYDAKIKSRRRRK